MVIFSEFYMRTFTVNKKSRTLFRISLVDRHEQNTSLIQRKGGAVDLTSHPVASLRWMVGGQKWQAFLMS